MQDHEIKAFINTYNQLWPNNSLMNSGFIAAIKPKLDKDRWYPEELKDALYRCANERGDRCGFAPRYPDILKYRPTQQLDHDNAWKAQFVEYVLKRGWDSALSYYLCPTSHDTADRAFVRNWLTGIGIGPETPQTYANKVFPYYLCELWSDMHTHGKPREAYQMAADRATNLQVKEFLQSKAVELDIYSLDLQRSLYPVLRTFRRLPPFERPRFVQDFQSKRNRKYRPKTIADSMPVIPELGKQDFFESQG